MENGGADFGAVGAELMSVMVGLGVVEGDEVGALFGWELEPFDDLVDALFVGEVGVEMEVVAGADALDRSLGAGPEEAGGAHALLLGEDP